MPGGVRVGAWGAIIARPTILSWAARLCTVGGRRSRQLERPWTSPGRDEALQHISTSTGAADAAANLAEYCDAGDRYANHSASDTCVDGPSNGR